MITQVTYSKFLASMASVLYNNGNNRAPDNIIAVERFNIANRIELYMSTMHGEKLL